MRPSLKVAGIKGPLLLIGNACPIIKIAIFEGLLKADKVWRHVQWLELPGYHVARAREVYKNVKDQQGNHNFFCEVQAIIFQSYPVNLGNEKCANYGEHQSEKYHEPRRPLKGSKRGYGMDDLPDK